MTELTTSKSEVWLPIEEFQGAYEVSTYGSVRSVTRVIQYSDNKPDRVLKGHMLSPQVDKYGYVRIRLRLNRKSVTRKVHRLVAQTFIANPKGKEQVNHIDGDKENNYISNLEWCTNSENQTHAISIGLKVIKIGKDSARYESPVEVLDMEGNYLYSLHGNKEMAEKGFDFRLVSAVVHGKRKSHCGHKFRRKYVKV